MKIQKIIPILHEKIGLLFISKFLDYSFHHKKKNTYLNERSIEYEFVLKNLLIHQCLEVLDVGTGSNSFSSALEHCGYNITATDLKEGSYWENFSNRHIHVVKDDITDSKINQTFDAILCISVLEHIPDFYSAVRGMSKLLKKNGILILSFPYTHDTYCPNVYQLDEADSIAKSFRYIGQSFSHKEIEQICTDNNLTLIGTQLAKGWSGKFWRSGERYNFPIKTDDIHTANMGCFLFKNEI